MSEQTVRAGIAGLGKMGLSHLAVLRAHPQIDVVAACDSNAYLTDTLAKYAALKCYPDYAAMLAGEQLDAVLIATPSRLHAPMVRQAIERGLHVFCEKPFVLDTADGEELVAGAKARNLTTQVGYHYRFVGAFEEAARVVRSGAIGHIHHVRVEAFGPVVLRQKGITWRASKEQGGGALYDYACHAIDLVNFVFAVPSAVSGVVRASVFSRDVDDEIYCTMHFPGGASGQLSVNWSDESFRKMATRISLWGTNGRIVADRQECQVYLRQPSESLAGYGPGWTIRYTTELTAPVWFYLRGEEYSAQIDYFARSILERRADGTNSFASALEADRVVAMILGEAAAPVAAGATAQPRRGLLGWLFGRSRR